MRTQKGFTLIELLIVVGILAVLATFTVLVLNPAQLFAQARDTQRISDLGVLKSAISFYLATVGDPKMSPEAGSKFCADNYWGTANDATKHFSRTLSGGLIFPGATDFRKVNGDGWIPIDFGLIPDGSLLSVLPIDPITPNVAARTYTYACDNTTKRFEINAKMESVRYKFGGANDVEKTDGGDKEEVYEIGNKPGLDL